jgi:hypothetical protein
VFNAKVFRQCKKCCPSENCRFITRYSPFATRCHFIICQSPVAAVFPDLPICRPYDLPKTRLGKSLALPFSLAPFEIRYLARPLNFAQSFPK